MTATMEVDKEVDTARPFAGAEVALRLPDDSLAVTRVLGDDGTLLLLEPPDVPVPLAGTRVRLWWARQEQDHLLVAHVEEEPGRGEPWTLRPGERAPDAPQRRGHFRVDDVVPVTLQLLDVLGQPQGAPRTAVTRNVSESGVGVRLPLEQAAGVEPGCVVSLVLQLPGKPESLRGRVVHVRAPHATHVEVGVMFLTPDRGATDRLRRHVFAVQRRELRKERARPT